jgi:predicted DNA-binding protein (MmcQ/YjbR family)
VQRQQLVEHCLGLPGAFLDTPFGDGEVAKVAGKIFCFLGLPGSEPAICVKNTAEVISEWRDRYPEHATVPRYLAKHLWNNVTLTGPGCPDFDDARELIDDSYALVVASLSKSKRP